MEAVVQRVQDGQEEDGCGCDARRDVAEHVELGAARAFGLVLEDHGHAAGLQGSHASFVARPRARGGRGPRACWPCVASRRLSCMTTLCTAARSCAGPEGSARSSSFSGRDGGSACVRSICARSSSRRRCASKRADLIARERQFLLGALALDRGRTVRTSARAPAGCAGRRRRARRSPRRGGQRRRSPAARGHAAPPRRRRGWPRGSARAARRSRSGPSPPSPLLGRRRPRGRLPPAPRSRCGGAEEVAIEDEVEDAAVVGRLGQGGRQRLLERRRARPLDLAERGEGVVEL